MSLMVAAKYDEIDYKIPMIKELQKLTRYKYSYKECLDEEGAIIMALDWHMHVITPEHIIQALLSVGVVFENDRVGTSEI